MVKNEINEVDEVGFKMRQEKAEGTKKMKGARNLGTQFSSLINGGFILM